MSETARLFLFDEVEWVDERADPKAPIEIIEEAERSGAARKRIATGESGFHLQYSTMPAGFHVPPHAHDHDELFIVVSGGCTMWANGPDEAVEMGPKDSAALVAGHEYSFTCGPDGMEFYVVRRGAAGLTHMSDKG